MESFAIGDRITLPRLNLIANVRAIWIDASGTKYEVEWITKDGRQETRWSDASEMTHAE